MPGKNIKFSDEDRKQNKLWRRFSQHAIKFRGTKRNHIGHRLCSKLQTILKPPCKWFNYIVKTRRSRTYALLERYSSIWQLVTATTEKSKFDAWRICVPKTSYHPNKTFFLFNFSFIRHQTNVFSPNLSVNQWPLQILFNQPRRILCNFYVRNFGGAIEIISSVFRMIYKSSVSLMNIRWKCAAFRTCTKF